MRILHPSAYLVATLLILSCTAPASGILSVAEHYDLQFDDMTWCKERSAKLESGGQELTLDDMELLIDLFEKKAGAKTKSVRLPRLWLSTFVLHHVMHSSTARVYLVLLMLVEWPPPISIYTVGESKTFTFTGFLRDDGLGKVSCAYFRCVIIDFLSCALS